MQPEHCYEQRTAGFGTSHQTGWIGVIARAMHLFATTTTDQVLELGKIAAVVETEKPASHNPVKPGNRKRSGAA